MTLVFLNPLKQAKSSISQTDYVLLEDTSRGVFLLDGFIGADEYGIGNPNTTVTVHNNTNYDVTIDVKVYGFHNGTYVHLAFQYSDLTKSNDSYPDGVMLIMDIDGSKSDIKSITYYGDSESYVARDQNQDPSRRAPPSNDAQSDINGTGTYSSNEHIFEMVFPLDSNDLGGNDAVLTTGDYFSCMFAVADNYNQGADYTTQFTLAFDNPPPHLLS